MWEFLESGVFWLLLLLWNLIIHLLLLTTNVLARVFLSTIASLNDRVLAIVVTEIHGIFHEVFFFRIP